MAPTSSLALLAALVALSPSIRAASSFSPLLPRQDAVTPLTQEEVAAFKPYTWYAATTACQLSAIMDWNCGEKCDANPTFKPIATGGDGDLTQFWFAGYDPTLNTVIVAHQGTDASKLLPVLTDLDIRQVNLNSTLFPGIDQSVLVHEGFAGTHSSEPRTQATDDKIPPPPMPWVYNLYDAEDGIPTLQSEMGLIDDPDLFSNILANIREIWRQHGVDRNVDYRKQDPETMAIVKKRALNEMPFLRKKYHNGWPVTVYLRRSLQHRMTVAAQRTFDDAPYKYRGKRFVVVNPDDLKDKLRNASHARFIEAWTGETGPMSNATRES